MMESTLRVAPKFAKDKQEFASVLRKRVNDYFSKNGLSTNADSKMVAKSIFYLFCWLGSYCIILFAPLNIWQLWLAWSFWGFSFAACAVNIGHDAIHGSYTKKAFLAKLLKLTFDLNGASSYMWSLMHNQAHHTYTNMLNHDEDVHPAPILRVSPDADYLPIHKNQGWYCFLLYPLATISWIFKKDYTKFFENTVANYNQRVHPKKELFFLFFYKFLNYTLFLIIPLLVVEAPFWQKLVGFLLGHFVAGFYLAIIFMLAHAVEKVEFPKTDINGMTENNWFIHQLKTTANFGTNSKIAAFLSGGLNQQVEHHLFPNICSTHYPSLSGIVRETAQEFDVPYHEYPTFWSALKSHARFMKSLSINPDK